MWMSSRRAGCVSAALLATPFRLCRRRPSCAVVYKFDARSLSRLVQDGSAAAPSSLETMIAGLPVFVGQTPTSGRGLYANRAITAGELIHTATPVVAHPTLGNLKTSCYHCLAPLSARRKQEWVRTHAGGDGGGASGHFCGTTCAETAWHLYHEIETAVGDAAAPLVNHCKTHGLKFPLALARLAFTTAQGSVSPNVTDNLVRVNFPKGVAPEDWLEEHAMLRVALVRGVAMANVANLRAKAAASASSKNAETKKQPFLNNLDALDQDWYVGTQSRMHLNVFRVEILAGEIGEGGTNKESGGNASGGGAGATSACGHDHGRGDSVTDTLNAPTGECGHDHGHGLGRVDIETYTGSSFAETLSVAMTQSVSGTGSGTALYAAPSLLNHSCDPNVEVRWAVDTNMALSARRDISQDEPLTITYIDADAPVAARREKLHFAYGFTCACERCLEEAGEETKL